MDPFLELPYSFSCHTRHHANAGKDKEEGFELVCITKEANSLLGYPWVTVFVVELQDPLSEVMSELRRFLRVETIQMSAHNEHWRVRCSGLRQAHTNQNTVFINKILL